MALVYFLYLENKNDLQTFFLPGGGSVFGGSGSSRPTEEREVKDTGRENR
jgi:hypothetical protein